MTINYTYDGLSRLTAADYSSGDYYHYTYDSVGNRLNETTAKGETAYTYDTANRLTSVNGQAVQWDDNGNMLADSQAVYTYNTANKLVGVTKGTSSIVYAYSGLGDRLRQIADGVTTDYTLDINAGLTQVLQDGKQTYLYGNQRISQIAETQTGYFLPDALGSMRQMTDPSADLTLARTYDPYGNVVSSSGTGETVYGYTGEIQSGGLVHLRARDYVSQLGIFNNQDKSIPDLSEPSDWNKFKYSQNNPINQTDPSGFCSGNKDDINNPDINCWMEILVIEGYYPNIKINSANWKTDELKSVNKALKAMEHSFGGREKFLTTFDYKVKTITIFRADWLWSLINGDKMAETATGLGFVTVFDKSYEDSYNIGSATLIHEFGHMLDAKYQHNLSGGQFQSLFWNICDNKEKSSNCIDHCIGLPVSDYGYASPAEDFSELFAWYVWTENGWEEKDLFPEFGIPDTKRMDYIKRLITIISENN